MSGDKNEPAVPFCVVQNRVCDRQCIAMCKRDFAVSSRKTGGRISNAQLHETREGQTGHKDDAGKAAFSLIPVESLHAQATIHTHGAQKYGVDNWRGGMPHTRLYDAIQRHLTAWMGGENTDPDSGHPHLWHALTSLGMLVWMQEKRPDLDDRWARR